MKYLNSVAFIKEFLKDSLTLDDIKKQFGSLTKAIESIKIETRFSDNFFPTQDNSYICDYYDELCTISKKSIFGFIPVTFTYVGSGCIKIEELTNFKYIHNKELFCDIATKVKHS